MLREDRDGLRSILSETSALPAEVQRADSDLRREEGASCRICCCSTPPRRRRWPRWPSTVSRMPEEPEVSFTTPAGASGGPSIDSPAPDRAGERANHMEILYFTERADRVPGGGAAHLSAKSRSAALLDGDLEPGWTGEAEESRRRLTTALCCAFVKETLGDCRWTRCAAVHEAGQPTLCA